jgi:hypothetical protein
LQVWPLFQRRLAIMEAMHHRCGADSPLRNLSKDIVEMIARNYMRLEHFSVEAIDATRNREIAPWAALGLQKPSQPSLIQRIWGTISWLTHR